MTQRELMKEMVAAFRQDCKEIFDAVGKAEAGQVLGAAVEFEVRRQALRRYAQVWQAAVTFRGKEWQRQAAPVCGCGARMRMVNRVPKQVLSILGELRFRRRHYYCGACRQSRWPFDEEMGIRGSWTGGAVRLITRAGIRESFTEACVSLKELAEMRVSRHTVRRITEGVAQDVASEQNAERLLGEESGQSFSRDDRAYVSMDGTMVNTLGGWREAKVGALYDQSKNLQHYAATLEPAATFGLMLRRHAMGLRFSRSGEKIAGGDGAEWIWNQMRLNFPTVNDAFLDFYHLGENVYRAAWAVYGEGTAKGKRWAKAKLQIAKEQGGQALVKTLERCRRKQKKRAARQALDDLLRYTRNHVDRMAYPDLRERGIDIGTGPQESACKNVIGKRLKGRGMRWALPNVEAMARLRALLYSTGSWEAFWSDRQAHRRAG
jgi:hypothetical protein